MSTHSGFFTQSTFGQKGNFELVVPSRRGGLMHFWRNNDAPTLPWSGPQLFGSANVNSAVLLQNSAGPFEVVAQVGNRLAAYSREARWKGPEYFGSDIGGSPAVIQASDGTMHMVVPLSAGGFAHFTRHAAQWETVKVFGAADGTAKSAVLIQSNFGDPGNLEMIAVTGTSLVHYWCDSGGEWHGPNPVPVDGGVPDGIPAFLQSRHGSKGHFEVVVPVNSGGLAHLRRDNDSADLNWFTHQLFAQGDCRAVSMIQSGFGSPGLGNFELIACIDNRLEHYWCDDQSLEWHGPSAVIYSEAPDQGATAGTWTIDHSCEPVGIHAALLHTNTVLFFAYEEHDQTHGVSSVFDPQTGAVQHVHQDEDLFCAGHAFLPNGDLLVAGGHVTGEKTVFLFQPDGDAGAWSQLPDMPVGRWYPTCSTLPNGSVFVVSGTKKSGGGAINDTYQVYHPTLGLQPPESALFLNETEPCNTYPWVFVLPSGKLFIFSNNRSCFFDLASMSFDSERFACIRQEPRTYPLEGTGVLLPLRPDSDPPYRARVLVMGGGGLPAERFTPATSTCEIFDVDAKPLGWRAAAPMLSQRVMPDSVLLPDGKVLVMNGSSAGKADDAISPVFSADLYDDVTNTWTPMANTRIPRLYHSTALLLADGTVMTAGMDETFNPEPFHYPEYRLEIFRPPYLFRGPRPQIQAAPGSVSYGVQFSISCEDASAIQSVTLLRAGSCTHSFNMDQRYVGLKIGKRVGKTLTLESPPNGNIAPPGVYLLFVLNGQQVPSIGKFISLS